MNSELKKEIKESEDKDEVINPPAFRALIWDALLTRTATEVAEMCGASPASVRRWLEGTNCPLPAVRVMIAHKLEA